MTETAEQLISEHHRIDDFVKAEGKRFAEFMKPHRDQLEEIENKLLAILNAQGSESIKADSGTAYISNIMSPKIIDRDAYIDWVLDKWDEIGNEMLQVSAPQKDALKQFMEENNKTLPPGVQVEFYRKLNVRRS